MAESKQARLLEFMLENRAHQGKCCEMLVRRAVDKLSPLFRIAESGRYELSEPYGFDKIAHAIWMATGTEVGGNWIIPVQASNLLEGALWMSTRVSREFWNEQKRRGDLWKAVEASISTSLEDRFYAMLRNDLRKDTGFGKALQLSTVLRQTLVDDLAESLETSIGARFTAPLRGSSFFFLAYALGGNEEMVDAISGLIEFLPYAIPLGERPDGNWLVLFK